MCRIVTSMYPSLDDDVITSPYNSVLAMRELTEHADCVLPVENQVFKRATFSCVFLSLIIFILISICLLSITSSFLVFNGNCE